MEGKYDLVYFDCFSGVAGDMMLASMFDAVRVCLFFFFSFFFFNINDVRTFLTGSVPDRVGISHEKAVTIDFI